MPDWEMWRWIKAMVQNNQLNDETIDKLVIVFKKAMDQIMSYIKENKIEEKILAKEKFDLQKKQQAEQDQENLAALDDMLKQL